MKTSDIRTLEAAILVLRRLAVRRHDDPQTLDPDDARAASLLVADLARLLNRLDPDSVPRG